MSRDRRRVMLEVGPKLDIRKLPIKAETTFWTAWRWSTGLVVNISIDAGARWGSMVLDHEGRRQEIGLEALPKPFGGVQWYALCPRTGRRVLTLWKPSGSPIFASRHTWRGQVAYRSQFEDGIARAWSAKRRITRKLGSDDPDDYELRRRPRGMRRRTYAGLVARYEHAEARLDHFAGAAIARLIQRYGRV